MNITFDDNLITGNKTIDSQHQELIDRIRQFVAACESGDSKIKAIKMLDYLDEYTNFHFQELICWITTSAPERSARRQSLATSASSAMDGEP